MQRRRMLLIFIFLVIALITTQSSLVSANYLWDCDGECLSIEVGRSEYLDYDQDGEDDDIITVFKVITSHEYMEHIFDLLGTKGPGLPEIGIVDIEEL